MCDTRLVTPPTLTRRQLLTGLVVVGVLAPLTGCAARIEPGSTEKLPGPAEDGDPLWSPEAKAFLIAIPERLLGVMDREYPLQLRGKAASGIVALKALCTYDRVRVSWCRGDGGFNCPTCESDYTRYGESLSGPATRGLDRFEVSISRSNDVVIDRTSVLAGPPRGVFLDPPDTTKPACRPVFPAG